MSDKKGKGEPKGKQRKDSELSEELGDDDKKMVGSMFTENLTSYLPPAIRRQYLRNMIKSLPPHSQKCVKALKKLQFEQLTLEVEFYKEIFQLQRKYQALYDPINEKRKQIVNGEYSPTEEESDWKTDDEEEELPSEFANKYKFKFDENVKGVPNFWLTVFQNNQLLVELIQSQDEDALKHLQDVKVVYKADESNSYIIEFHFSPNKYFTNTVLTKNYFLDTSIDSKKPLVFEGPEIFKSVGCEINWHKGMNLTVKTIKKKQKHKARNAVRTVTKQVPTESFFNFFRTFDIPEDVESVDMETQATLQTDYEIGHMLRERIIQKAVLFYTGDLIDSDDDDDLDEEEDEGEEEEEEDEDDDDEEEGSGNNKPDKKSKKVTANDCPQQ